MAVPVPELYRVRRMVRLNLTVETVEALKRRRIHLARYVDRFLAELLFALEHNRPIRIGRIEEDVV